MTPTKYTLLGGPFELVQGDDFVFDLFAVDGESNPVDLTDAVFMTQIKGPNGEGSVSFDNSKHAIIDAELGAFTLTLDDTDTASLGLGEHKDLLTQITIGDSVVYYRGQNLLTVFFNQPNQ